MPLPSWHPRPCSNWPKRMQWCAASRTTRVEICALTPNTRGLHRAAAVGADNVLIFLSVSESHNLENLHRSVDALIEGIDAMCELVAGLGIAPKGSIAMTFGCPAKATSQSNRRCASRATCCPRAAHHAR